MSTRHFTVLASLSALAGALPSGCGDEEVATGATAEFQADLFFAGGSLTLEQTVDPDEVNEVAGLKGSIACGGIDASRSVLSLVDYAGDADETIEIRAVLLDGVDSIDLLAWTATPGDKGKQVSFASAAAGLRQEAVDRISEILVRDEHAFYKVRYSVTASGKLDFLRLQVVQVLRVATEKGTCPSTTL